MLLGQASNVVSYQRQFSILFNLIKDARKANSLLKGKATSLQKHDGNLLWKKFRAYMIETETSKKKPMEMFKTIASPQSSRKPFSKIPLSISTKKKRITGGDSSSHKKRFR